MLSEWLKPLPVEPFIRRQVGKAPFAMAGAARAAVPMLGWETLERVLATVPADEVLVVAQGKLIAMPTPRSLAVVRALLGEGIGLVVRGAERHDRGLEEVAAGFARELNGKVRIQLFVTPGGTHGFDWHYDDEEVFIAQTLGAKEYFFRENTVARQTPASSAGDFGLIRKETSPIATARLTPGDWAYIPSRWWHVAYCVEQSLSISVGVLPGAAG